MGNSILSGMEIIKLQIYILGVEARFRGKRLLDSINDAGYSCEVVWGEDSRMKPKRLGNFDRWLSWVVNGREISVGEYCCAMGHQRILKTFLDTGQDWALILEEDARILHDISLIAELTKDRRGPTILHLGGLDQTLRSIKEENFWLTEVQTQIAGNEKVVLFRVVGNVFGTYGFLINREAAEIAVSGNDRLLFPQLADWPSTWRYKTNFLISEESFVSVETNGSDLVEGRIKLVNSSKSLSGKSIFQKFRGWMKLLRNVFLIEPAFKSFFGLSFGSVIHENIYLYLNSRILLRLRNLSSDISENEKIN
jgi:hypothetical protein